MGNTCVFNKRKNVNDISTQISFSSGSSSRVVPQMNLHLMESAKQLLDMNVYRAESGGEKSSFFIKVSCKGEFGLFWVDYDNNLSRYGTVKQGDDFCVNSYLRHSFVLMEESKNRVLLGYKLLDLRRTVIHLKKVDPSVDASVELQCQGCWLATGETAGDKLTEGLSSLPGENPPSVLLTFKNNTKSILLINWIDFKGDFVEMGQVNSLEETSIGTYPEHYFVISEKTNNIHHNVVLVKLKHSIATTIEISTVKSQLVACTYITKPKVIVQCTSKYTLWNFKGFQVQLEEGIEVDHPDLRSKLMEDFDYIHQGISPPQLEFLKTVPIWVNKRIIFGPEEKSHSWSGACYHSSQEWLLDNGNMVEKAQSIEIYVAEQYLNGRKSNSPAQVLIHEFSHALHHAFNYDREDIKQAYEEAMLAKKYMDVEHFNGKCSKGYASTNHMEYFAEMTVCYYSRCNYFPFDRKGLQEYDPQGYKTVQHLWQMNHDQFQKEIQKFKSSKAIDLSLQQQPPP